MKTIAIFSIAIFSLIFTNCDETKKVIDVASTVQLSGNYRVSEIGNTDLGSSDLTFTMAALDKSIRGNSSCNTFFGNYTVDLYALSFGTFAITEMYCDEPIMDIERAYLKALHNTGSFSIENSILTLYSKVDRSVVLKANKEVNKEKK
jgi:heat shock protein HslJ